MLHRYTNEEEHFLINNVKGITLKELTKKFNEKFNLNISEISIENKKRALKLKSGIVGGQFKKGHKAFNKGKKWKEYLTKEQQEKAKTTLFKKGNVPANHREIGSERINVDGYIEIKVGEPRKWRLKHKVIYEEYYGAIPKGYNVIFADGNKMNLSINNLLLVSDSELLIMNRNKLIYQDNELTKAGLNIAKVIKKTNKLKKRYKNAND